MHKSKLMAVVIAGSLVGLAACGKEEATTTKSETKQTSTDGSTTTQKTESKEVGNTLEATTTTTADTSAGAVKSVTNTFIGTVTIYTPGKTIEVMTGNKETHSFALDGKDSIVAIDGATAVGSKVMLVEDKGEKGFHKITVTPSA
ncbi:MAG: hypothetical protein ABIR28_01215 [Vicinamibacteria bacterium]